MPPLSSGDCKFFGVTPEEMETPVTDVVNDEKAVVDLDAAQPQPGVASDELVRQVAEAARRRGLRQARSGRPGRRQFPQRQARQDALDRGRSGTGRGAARP